LLVERTKLSIVSQSLHVYDITLVVGRADWSRGRNELQRELRPADVTASMSATKTFFLHLVMTYGAIKNEDDANDNTSIARQHAPQHTRGGGVRKQDETFHEDQTYYLHRANMTSYYDRFRRALLVMLPIVVAAVLVGGAVFLLLRNFQYLYPSPSGSLHDRWSIHQESENSVQVNDGVDSSISSVPYNAVRDHVSSTSLHSSAAILNNTAAAASAAACEANPLCAKLGLTGDCCPTQDGTTFLLCCHQ
jgi:hypothetical protein